MTEQTLYVFTGSVKDNFWRNESAFVNSRGYSINVFNVAL